MSKNPLSRAVEIVGTQKGLADALTALKMVKPNGDVMSFRQSHVWDWLQRGYPPAEVCAGIEHVTGVPREELRPDVFAQRIAGADA